MVLKRLFGGPGTAHAETSVSDAEQRVAGGDAVLIDVREPDEWRQGHAPGATSIPLAQLSARLASLPRDRDILLICRSGNRSRVTQDLLARSGFDRATNVAGGMIAWQRHGLPITTGK
jgi:rhodanese-related sulfurtransferase